jgi:hypothetical protein
MGIQMKSFDAVANALSALTTTKRFKSSTITVQLGERPITIPASAFPDVAKAVATFGLNGASPEDAKVEPISNRKLAEKAGVSLLQPSQATPPAPAPASPSPAAPAPAAAKSKPAPSSEGRKSRRPARPSQDKMPKWFEKDFNKEYTFAEDHYSMRRARLSIDPQRSKKVLGEWKKKGELSAWGYEILTGKKHVGWVIAEEQNHFVITGVPDMAPSDHRAFIGVLARIATTIIPEIRRR